MVLHMLVQFPLLMLGAALLVDALPAASRNRLGSFNQLGISGLTFAVLVSSVWMIPRALDLAVQVGWVDGLKILTLLLAGMAVRLSWPRAVLSLQAFFLIGWAMMTATIGLLYQEVPMRLCTSYLQDEQTNTGIGLVALSGSLVLVWFGQSLNAMVRRKPSA